MECFDKCIKNGSCTCCAECSEECEYRCTANGSRIMYGDNVSYCKGGIGNYEERKERRSRDRLERFRRKKKRNMIIKQLLLVLLLIIGVLIVSEAIERHESEEAVHNCTPAVEEPLDEPAEPVSREYYREPLKLSEGVETTLTAYCPCTKCCGVWGENRPNGVVYTASGDIAQEGVTVAADWSIYPKGTQLMINENVYTVQDVGGAVKGNHIDIYFDTHEEAVAFGKQTAIVSVIEK